MTDPRPQPRRRPRVIGVSPTAVPPDAGLQAERTSLSWARTWAVVGVNITLVAKLVGELSWLWASVFSLLTVVPLLALLRVQRGHERRVGRFVRAGEVQQTQALYNVGLVAMIIVISACGLAAVLVQALG
ncbi:hypothetical protein [uncultured Dietzia sp.]|uniref:hypothetical protein n=1 Tax=uncultured Dietzia sp. TaxID=395519 RepID=UPI0025F36D43|nr:hypothetical protein [uncultured Dietzia sp.]